MIEKIVLDYLNKMLDVPVYMEEPTEHLQSYVVLEKTGGSKKNYICSATLAIQSYGETLYEAASLNEKVKTAMEDIIVLDEVSKSALNSDYNYTDTEKKKYRYQAVFNLSYY